MFENGTLHLRNPETHLFGTVFAGDVCPDKNGSILSRTSNDARTDKARGLMSEIETFQYPEWIRNEEKLR